MKVVIGVIVFLVILLLIVRRVRGEERRYNKKRKGPRIPHAPECEHGGGFTVQCRRRTHEAETAMGMGEEPDRKQRRKYH
jgi:hypothetical protein